MKDNDIKQVKFVEFDPNDIPSDVKLRVGYQLWLVQQGDDPTDWKPMPSVGPGVREIRITGKDGAFRVFYVVNRPEAIYVLHAFQKTTQKTEKRDIDLAKARLKSLG